jgi:hypothetical protein
MIALDIPTLIFCALLIIGIAAWIVLADDIKAFRESHRPTPPSDPKPWGDVIRDPRADGPFRHVGSDKL